MITTEKPDLSDEYTLLGNMIMNTSVLSACHSRYKAGELKTKHFTEHYRPVVRWLFRYYNEYQKAPKRTIQQIFNRRKRSLSEDAQDIIEQALDRLAEEYAENEEVDTEYINKEILLNYIRQKETEGLAEKVLGKLDIGDPEEAEKLIKTYAAISEDEDEDEVLQFFNGEDIEQDWDSGSASVDIAYQFDGDLNRIITPLDKGWLFAVTGIEKVGKSYFMGEMAYQAALYQKKKVLIINLELTKKIARNRMRRRISYTTNEQYAGRIVYPILDCENNQQGTCMVRKRARPGLFRTIQEVVTYRSHRDWRICDKCRGHVRRNAAKTKRFMPAVWFEQERVKALTEIRFRRSLRDARFLRLSNLRTKCFPRFSKTFDETRDFILRYIDKNKWKPEMIVYDYLDILAPEAGRMDERIIVDRNWKKASRLAGELDCLLITADQATKASRTNRSLDQMSTSESKTKDGHLDARIGVNQTENEKRLQVSRIGTIFHRHAPFNIRDEVMVTQRLATAEAFIDNASWSTYHDNYRVQVERK